MTKRIPCATCPFRTDIELSLTAAKVQTILDALQHDGDFPCHHTTLATGNLPHQDQACMGAAIFLEHVREGGLRANLAFRMREGWLEEFNREELEMDAPVFRDVGSFVAAKTRLFKVEDGPLKQLR